MVFHDNVALTVGLYQREVNAGLVEYVEGFCKRGFCSLPFRIAHAIVMHLVRHLPVLTNHDVVTLTGQVYMEVTLLIEHPLHGTLKTLC